MEKNKKYYAIADELYVSTLCDTDDLEEFVKICCAYGSDDGFRAWIGNKEIDVKEYQYPMPEYESENPMPEYEPEKKDSLLRTIMKRLRLTW